MSRHYDWDHMQRERGGTKTEKEIGTATKQMRSGERQKGRKEREKVTKRRVEAEETLEKTACEYANSGPLKWRWRGGRIKSSERCVIMDQFAAIKPPYGWSLWNGEISAPQGQPWWQWRSQTTGVTGGDMLMEGGERRRDKGEGNIVSWTRWSLDVSVPARAERLSNHVNVEERWRDAGLWPPLTRMQMLLYCTDTKNECYTLSTQSDTERHIRPSLTKCTTFLLI